MRRDERYAEFEVTIFDEEILDAMFETTLSWRVVEGGTSRLG